MSKTLIAMWVGIGLLVLSWLVPPWKDYSAAPGGAPEFRSFVGVPGSNSLNVAKLLLIDSMIATVTLGAMATLWKK